MRKIDIELLREQRDTLCLVASRIENQVSRNPVHFETHVAEHLEGIIIFLDDTLDAVEKRGVYNTTSDAEHDPRYDY